MYITGVSGIDTAPAGVALFPGRPPKRPRDSRTAETGKSMRQEERSVVNISSNGSEVISVISSKSFSVPAWDPDWSGLVFEEPLSPLEQLSADDAIETFAEFEAAEGSVMLLNCSGFLTGSRHRCLGAAYSNLTFERLTARELFWAVNSKIEVSLSAVGTLMAANSQIRAHGNVQCDKIILQDSVLDCDQQVIEDLEIARGSGQGISVWVNDLLLIGNSYIDSGLNVMTNRVEMQQEYFRYLPVNFGVDNSAETLTLYRPDDVRQAYSQCFIRQGLLLPANNPLLLPGINLPAEQGVSEAIRWEMRSELGRYAALPGEGAVNINAIYVFAQFAPKSPVKAKLTFAVIRGDEVSTVSRPVTPFPRP